jgi:hypothetical protein
MIMSFIMRQNWGTVGGVKPDGLHHNDPHAQVLEDVERSQRNTLWPDAMLNSSSVDALLWKGSPKATKVQRVGIAIFGLLFLSLGLFFMFALAPELHSPLVAVFGIFPFAVGIKVTFNAFKQKTTIKHRSKQ